MLLELKMQAQQVWAVLHQDVPKQAMQVLSALYARLWRQLQPNSGDAWKHSKPSNESLPQFLPIIKGLTDHCTGN